MAEPVINIIATGRTGRIFHKRRQRESNTADATKSIDTWPPAWRTLATTWLRRTASGNTRCKWETLLAMAGGTAFETAHDLLEAMLASAWVRLDEVWRDGRWQVIWIEFTALASLRAALGLPDQAALQTTAHHAFAALLADPTACAFHAAAEDAATLRPALALARIELLVALSRWTARTQATRRDFAQFARGDTKSITSAEWDWLDARVDLAACGIGGHSPLLCIAAPLRLLLPRGALNLDAAADFVALPPATLAPTITTTITAESQVTLWTLVENRTSFERVARQRGAGEGVLWLPGFAPGWWQTAISQLLKLAPAAARIACDPDPAGIEIALHAGKLWQDAQLEWSPWHMSAADLASLTQRKPLTAHDQARVTALRNRVLPAMLGELLEALASRGEKGEQEGLL
jgi:hypothetical protein